MDYKRITLLSGHYGSGKTNLAVNMALDLKRRLEDGARKEPGKSGIAYRASSSECVSSAVTVADLDIVNPYFRTLDSREVFEKAGIGLIVSEFANTNLDAPALPGEMYRIVEDTDTRFVVDVGGDDRGALALGRLSGRILAEGDYDMFLVINKYRPLTPDAESVVEVMREIEVASRLRFTGIINNSNLGALTTPETVLSSLEYASEASRLSGLPLVLTSVSKDVYNDLQGKIENLFAMDLQKRPV